MNAADTPGPGDHTPSAGRCTSCASRLASDQRYCVNCGTRRGPLPARVEATLGEMRRNGAPAPVTDPAVDPTLDPGADPALDPGTQPSGEPVPVGASSGGWL